jgi:1-deoxy-D-xylulose-5-phosphate reductoisomerase
MGVSFAETQSMRNVVVLGSTGSVGKSALEVIEHFPDSFRVTGLMANSSVEELAAQALKYNARAVAAADDSKLGELRELLAGSDIQVLSREEALGSMVGADDTDVVLSAIVGVAGLAPAMAAIRAGKILAVANKEPLVAAGPLLMAAAREHGATIVPVDSEHSAIFQALRAGKAEEVRTILLTGSGGPFRERPLDTFDRITPAQALDHPTWDMGPKITIDSATMMNKALEIVEAVHLFDVPPEKIRVVLHPQSIVHSMVEFCDGSVVAQMSPPDMKLPVLFALSYPERLPYEEVRFRIGDFRTLSFMDPDLDRYPALALGFSAAREGGLAGAVLNAANEVAVSAFLNERIPFLRITEIVGEVLHRHERRNDPALPDVLRADRWARAEVETCLTR